MSEFESMANKKIEELASKSLKNHNKDLMDLLRDNYKILEKKLKIYCKLANVSYIDTVIEILEQYGYKDLNKQVITTYLNRVKKANGG